MSNLEHTPVCDQGCDNPNCTLIQCRECGDEWPCEISRLRAELAAVKAEARHLENNLDVQRTGRATAERAVASLVSQLDDANADNARLQAKLGTTQQEATCYRAQRDQAWAERDTANARGAA
jgi:septal ring factor EnvC (AmiA/AmiB activator)